jgi:hypothetical protein
VKEHKGQNSDLKVTDSEIFIHDNRYFFYLFASLSDIKQLPAIPHQPYNVTRLIHYSNRIGRCSYNGARSGQYKRMCGAFDSE